MLVTDPVTRGKLWKPLIVPGEVKECTDCSFPTHLVLHADTEETDHREVIFQV